MKEELATAVGRDKWGENNCIKVRAHTGRSSEDLCPFWSQPDLIPLKALDFLEYRDLAD